VLAHHNLVDLGGGRVPSWFPYCIHTSAQMAIGVVGLLADPLHIAWVVIGLGNPQVFYKLPAPALLKTRTW
jgi:hypothetical protein